VWFESCHVQTDVNSAGDQLGCDDYLISGPSNVIDPLSYWHTLSDSDLPTLWYLPSEEKDIYKLTMLVNCVLHCVDVSKLISCYLLYCDH
jgi:hypothetical protein